MEPAFPLLMAASVEWMTRPVGDRGDGLTAGALDLPFAVNSIVAPSGRACRLRALATACISSRERSDVTG